MIAMQDYEEVANQSETLRKRGDDLQNLTRVPARVAKRPRAVFSLRLASGELSLISAAAKRRGMNLSDFVREAALSAAAGTLDLQIGQRARALQDVREHVRALAETMRQL